MQKKFDICTIGSVTLDTFLAPAEMDFWQPRGKSKKMAFDVGAKILTKTLARHIGGSSANSAIGFGKLEMKTAVLGTIGDDDHGAFILHQLEKLNVETKFLKIQKNQPSESSLVFVTPEGQRTIFHETNERKSHHSFPKTHAIYIGHLTENEEKIWEKIIERKLNRWKKNPLIVAWNPGKTQFESGFGKYQNFFPHVDILILNVEEAELFSGKKSKQISREKSTGTSLNFQKNLPKKIADLNSIAEKFLNAGVKTVVITDGPRGAQLFQEEKNSHKILHLIAPVICDDAPVSTLGAGDSFSVGVLAARLKNLSPVSQLLWGSLNSNAVIREFGAQNGQLRLRAMQHSVKMVVKRK
ncbi:hypothetical protein HN954_03270 [bacterium]|jgi:sugar/nucleoside kinase (ribokinase family)|nr:hypothetical protein [bacterium]MBT6832130.1 hypothetical protein [bacterium]MBT6996424.1 hypothetical protein [bacterium]MBT7772159.1 hypothetical protein [bacterium]